MWFTYILYSNSIDKYYVGHTNDLYWRLERHNAGWNVDNILGILKSVSQEHGVVKFNSKIPSQIKEGSILTIIPIHSCLTGNLMKRYISLSNDVITRI